MSLNRYTPGSLSEEPRYDAETLRKVTVLAQQLQNRREQTLSVREMEAIGAEVGLDPAFIRQALEQVTRPESPGKTKPDVRTEARPPVPNANAAALAAEARRREGLAGAWWAAGWTLPLIGVLATVSFGHGGEGPFTGLMFFVGLAVYIFRGVTLGHQAETAKEDAKAALQPAAQVPAQAASVQAAPARVSENAPLSRSAMLEMLFALQRTLEAARQRRAFLSVDVAGSSEMKQGAADLSVEYSFGQYRQWVEDVVRGWGGEVHSAAGDGMMAMFPNEGAALRAARQLFHELPRFNAERNRLFLPFRLRCGLSAGEVPLDPATPLGNLHSPVIDRAAALQKQAEPGTVLLGSDAAGALPPDLQESLSPSGGDAVLGSPPAYTWRLPR